MLSLSTGGRKVLDFKLILTFVSQHTVIIQAALF